MIRGRVQIQGVRTLVRKLDRLPDAVNRQVREEALMEAAEPIRALAEDLAPRRHGILKRDMEKRPVSGQTFVGGAEATVAVGPEGDAFWGLFQEMGTARHAAQPFLRPAFDREKGNAVRIAGRVLGRAIERAAQ